jgi:hypothetical protein
VAAKGCQGVRTGVAITPGSAYFVAITGNDLRASVAERPVVLPPGHRKGSDTCRDLKSVSLVKPAQP